MLNQIMNKKAHQALKSVSQNKEATKEILNLLVRMREESVKQLVEYTNTVDIHRTQGAISNIDTITHLFANPETYDKYFEKE